MSTGLLRTPAPAVGIDLGTTMSAMAFVSQDGNVAMLPGASGSLLTPSVLFFENQVWVGSPAAERGLASPDQVAECFKRDMGKPHYHRHVRGRSVPPEVLSAFLLEQLKRDAEAALGGVRDVVIAVPAYFDEARRHATQEAGRLAGWNVLDIINEPTAAAIAHGYHHRQFLPNDLLDRSWRMLVYDLGGGTFDVSLLECHQRVFKTLATDGDVQLGGRDFDLKLLTHVAERFVERHGLDPRGDPRQLQRLWQLARETKHALSENQRTTAVVEHAGIRMPIEIARDEFEELIEPLVERTLHTCGDVVRQAGLNWSDLDLVLLVGGSSRIPLVSQKMEELTSVKPVLSDLPDELVAQGAALYAASQSSPGSAPFSVVNVNAHSLGIAGIDVKAGVPVNKILIPRNTALPVSKSFKFVTRKPNQENVKVQVLEGESENPKHCIPIGQCVVDLERNLPEGVAVEVTCHYLGNGTISVSARQPDTRRSSFVEIRRDGPRQIDSLPIWRMRLTTGEEPSPAMLVAESATNLPPIVDAQDKGQVLKRLDSLWKQLGRRCAMGAVPAAALSSQRLLHEADAELNVAEQLARRITALLGLAKSEGERNALNFELSQAKVYQTQAHSLSRFAATALGRECLAAGFCPTGMEAEIREITELLPLCGEK